MADEKIIDRVQKLLSKADGNTTPEEAEALIGKATELMERHMISEAMLQSRGQMPRDEITSIHIPFGSTYWMAWRLVAVQLGDAFGFRILLINNGKNGGLRWFGFQSELRSAEVIWTSLMIQAERMARQHMASCDVYGTEARFKEKRSFLQGFGITCARRIEEARRRARTDHVETTGDDLLPVLRDRDAQIDQYWNDKIAPGTSAARITGGQYSPRGYEAGRKAGERANVGEPEVGGSRGALGR